MARKVRIALRGWLVPGKDDALIEMWQREATGEKQRILIEALENHYRIPPSKRRNPLKAISMDVAATRQKLEELPELLLSKIAEMLAGLQVVDPDATKPMKAVNTEKEADRLSDEELEQRRQNRKLNQW